MSLKILLDSTDNFSSRLNTGILWQNLELKQNNEITYVQKILDVQIMKRRPLL